LELESEIELPGFRSGVQESQVQIRLGTAPTRIENPLREGVLFQASPDRFLLSIPGVARFLVSDGTEILVEPSETSTHEELRLFLFGTPWGALLRQRGMLALHASAVFTPQGAVLFCGGSAAGKSTIAAALHARGFLLLCDEICAITSAEGRSVLHPGPSTALLWPDSSERLGLLPSDGTTVRPGVAKRRFNFPSGSDASAVPIHAAYVLEPHSSEMSISGIAGYERFETLARRLFLLHAFRGLDGPRSSSEELFALARTARVRIVRRPREGFLLAELADAIEGDMGA
jgi:hypothetical protein